MAATTATPLPRPPDTPPDLSPLHSRRYARSPALLFLPSSIKPSPKITTGRRRASCFVARSGTAMGENAVSDERMLVMVPPHPLIKHWISVLRNEQTPCAIFKSAMAELGRLLIYEASRDWLVSMLLRPSGSTHFLLCMKPMLQAHGMYLSSEGTRTASSAQPGLPILVIGINILAFACHHDLSCKIIEQNMGNVFPTSQEEIDHHINDPYG